MISIFNVNIEEMFESYDVVMEVYIEGNLTSRQQMQAPKQMLIANFMQTAKQIQNDRRPIKIKMIIPNIIWDNFEKKQRMLNNYVELSNNAMVAWQESKR